MLRKIFPDSKFYPPATKVEIEAIEIELGVQLPDQLQSLYLESNGFREDRGNAKYLLSLRENSHSNSLLSITRFFWHEWPSYYPQLNFRPYIFFGSSSGDECWGINYQKTGEIIAYHHGMENHYEIVGSDIIEVYQADYAQYEEIVDEIDLIEK